MGVEELNSGTFSADKEGAWEEEQQAGEKGAVCFFFPSRGSRLSCQNHRECSL